VNVSASVPFGVDAYTDGDERCYVLRGAAHVTLVFESFMTEYKHDFVTVYDGPGDANGRAFSGELPTPFVWRSKRTPVLVRFVADETSLRRRRR